MLIDLPVDLLCVYGHTYIKVGLRFRFRFVRVGGDAWVGGWSVCAVVVVVVSLFLFVVGFCFRFECVVDGSPHFSSRLTSHVSSHISRP